jgi:hypothetical protein
MIIEKLLHATTHGTKIEFPIKLPKSVMSQPPSVQPPTADTISITPVLSISGPALINRDGVFVRMAEILPMDLGPGNQNLKEVIGCFIRSMEKLPPFTNLQLTSLPTPYEGGKDLEHFISRGKDLIDCAKASPDISDAWRRQYTNLGVSALAMGSALAKSFDKTHPHQQALLLTMTFDPSSGMNRGQMIGKDGKVALDKLQYLHAQSLAVNDKLEEEFYLVLQAFKNSNIAVRELPPGEMCRQIWSAMHPLAMGKAGETSQDVFAELLNDQLPFSRMPEVSEFENAASPEALASLLVPQTLLEQENYLQIDGTYCAGYVVHDFIPYQPANMSMLPELPGSMAASLYLEVKDPAEMAERLKSRQTQLASNHESRNRFGMVEDNVADDEYQMVQSSRRLVEVARQMPIYIRFYVQPSAPTLPALEKQCKDLERALRLAGASYFPVRWTQMPLWESILPCGINSLAQKPRNMTAESLGTFFWPARTSLKENGNGTYIAVDLDTGTPIFYDFFGDKNERNPSWLLLAKPGGGKSVMIRAMSTADNIVGGRVFMIDLEGENKSWCEHYGGRYIEIGKPDGETINPLDAPPDSEQPIEDSIHQFLSFYQIIMGSSEPLRPGAEKNALIDAYMSVLEDRKWISKDPATGMWIPVLSPEEYNSQDAPILSDVTSVLANMGEVGVSLAEKFRQFSDKSGLYARYTNVRTSFNIRTEQLVVFGLKHLADHDPVMLNLCLFELFQLIWTEILRSNHVNPDIRHYVTLDEAKFLLDIPTAADWLEKLGSRLRKRRGSLGLASQKVHEFMDNPSGRRILSVMGTKFLLAQEPTETGLLQELLGLTKAEANYLTQVEKGHGLALFPHGIHKRIHVDSPDEWKAVLDKGNLIA